MWVTLRGANFSMYIVLSFQDFLGCLSSFLSNFPPGKPSSSGLAEHLQQCKVGAQPCSYRHKHSCVGGFNREGGCDLLFRLLSSDISLSFPPAPEDFVLQPAAINPNHAVGMLGGRFLLHQP